MSRLRQDPDALDEREQTINPFNRNAHGLQKSREEIWAELRAQAETWKPRNDIHAKCVDDERGKDGA
mgnify:CR=1 FL=1